MTCPNVDILSRFADLTLADGEAMDVAEHLAVCEACTRKVEELEHRPEQTMLAALRDMKDAPTDDTDPPLPKVIGQYEILERIGSGGMGVVYRAVHPHLKREVALKVIRDTRLDDPTARERFVQEMQSLGKLMHPNIVHATDASIDGDTPFIVTELLDGQDLGSYIAEHGKMPVKQAVDCIRQAATGLAYAHKAGYVHRDIKPSNLFLLRGGIVKILDLDIARPMGVDASQTSTGHVAGSPEFMAPEQFRGGTADARSDIYSLGQTFASLLSESIPSRLKPILARMTAGLPDHRYQTADELVRALDAAAKNSRIVLWMSTALVSLLAVVGFMLLTSTDAPVVETKTKHLVEVPSAPEPEPTQNEKDFSAPSFEITSLAGWDDFFESIVNCYHVNRDSSDAALGGFTPFSLLHRLDRASDAQRLVSLRLSKPLSGDPLSQALARITDLNTVANWEAALGDKGKADEYHARIEELIAAETSDLKRDRLNRHYEDQKEKSRIPQEYVVEKKLVDAIGQGEPSVKDLCDQGQYREALKRYLAVTGDAPTLEFGLPYAGYGAAYIVSRMVEKGDLDAAAKLRQDAVSSESMSFRMACFLALGYLKAGRKDEAQSVWNDSIEKLTDRMNHRAPFGEKLGFLNALLESVADTGLYEYVRSEPMKTPEQIEKLRRMSENKKSSTRFKQEMLDYKKAKAEWEKTREGKPPAMPDMPDILPPVIEF